MRVVEAVVEGTEGPNIQTWVMVMGAFTYSVMDIYRRLHKEASGQAWAWSGEGGGGEETSVGAGNALPPVRLLGRCGHQLQANTENVHPNGLGKGGVVGDERCVRLEPRGPLGCREVAANHASPSATGDGVTPVLARVGAGRCTA